MRRFSLTSVEDQIVALLTAWGMPSDPARTTARVMADTDACGIDSHGISMLMRYEELRTAGSLDLTAAPRIVSEAPAFAVLDAGHGLGHPAAIRAVDLAADKARSTGIALAAVRNSHHFGAAGVYARRAAEQGLIALLTSTTSISGVIPTGGALPVLGTNPLAFAAPVQDAPPFVLDMSTSIVAVNKVKAKWLAGQPIPEGWVVDGHSSPVTDAGEAFRMLMEDDTGGLAPLGGPGTDLGGHKGFGLSLMVQLLSTALVGAPSPGHGGRHHEISHVFIVIDPAVITGGRVDSAAEVAVQTARTRRSAQAASAGTGGGLGVRIPGEPEEATRAERTAHGLPLPESLVDLVTGMCERAGVGVLLRDVSA